MTLPSVRYMIPKASNACKQHQVDIHSACWEGLLCVCKKHTYSRLTVNLSVTTALVTKKFVLTSRFPYSKGPLQSDGSDWVPMTWSLHRDCPHIECYYKESLLYTESDIQIGALLAQRAPCRAYALAMCRSQSCSACAWSHHNSHDSHSRQRHHA